MNPTYPHVRVKLIGEDGNAMAIIARVAAELRREVGPEAADVFVSAAIDSPSYDHLLGFVQETVTVY